MNVVITGGSRGIGAAAVRLFARRGDRVWFLYEKNDAAARGANSRTAAAPMPRLPPVITTFIGFSF